MPGLPFQWFENYLKNCTQYVRIGDVESNMATITCGVPQGSTLTAQINFNSFRIFADDNNIFFVSKNLITCSKVLRHQQTVYLPSVTV